MAKIGFIGIGNMGYAMLKGCLQYFNKADLLITDMNTQRMEEVSRETGVECAYSNAECANRSKFVVLAVKPQFYSQVLKSIENVVTERHVIISIAPGKSISGIKESLDKPVRVVRAMPNTPALIGEGMTGVSIPDGTLDPEEREVVERFFCSFGKMCVVDEKMLSTVTCISGSSPAYVYMFIEALADSGVKYGMPRKDAYELAAQTVAGAAKMVLETGMHPGELKDMVCSPGGTTIAAVAALEEQGFRNTIIKATDACYKRAEEL